MNDRIVVPPNLRKAIFQDLHSCYLSVDKIKSLVRRIVWWSEINADISSFVLKCARCLFKRPSVKPYGWTPWPLIYMPWQRIHADCCGPFLKKYYALILIDSCSKCPGAFLSTKANGIFTKLAMRRTLLLTVVTQARLVEIDWFPVCIYRSLTSRVH